MLIAYFAVLRRHSMTQMLKVAWMVYAQVAGAVQVEMVLQAAEYEAAQGLALQPFFDSTAGRFQTATGRAWAAEIHRRRAGDSAGEPRSSLFAAPWGAHLMQQKATLEAEILPNCRYLPSPGLRDAGLHSGDGGAATAGCGGGVALEETSTATAAKPRREAAAQASDERKQQVLRGGVGGSGSHRGTSGDGGNLAEA